MNTNDWGDTLEYLNYALTFEVGIPIVTSQQQRSAGSLTSINGEHLFTPSNWNFSRVTAVYVEIEWESVSSGDIDLYDETGSSKLSDLVTPTGATSKDVSRYDVTSSITGLSSQKKLAIQIAGDGAGNNLIVYTAKLILVMKVM